jgi:hypothetical protein
MRIKFLLEISGEDVVHRMAGNVVAVWEELFVAMELLARLVGVELKIGL